MAPHFSPPVPPFVVFSVEGTPDATNIPEMDRRLNLRRRGDDELAVIRILGFARAAPPGR